MIRAVVDANTIVSAIISPKGPSRQVYEAWLNNRFTLVTSPATIAEVAKVLGYDRIRLRYKLSDEDIRTAKALLWTQSDLMEGTVVVHGVAPHPEDDKLLSCAIEGGARFIVTGDKAFQACGEHEGIRIISPRAFIELLESNPD